MSSVFVDEEDVFTDVDVDSVRHVILKIFLNSRQTTTLRTSVSAPRESRTLVVYHVSSFEEDGTRPGGLGREKE